jgi:hypothetical protein
MRPANWPAQPAEPPRPPKPTRPRQGCFQVAATILGLLIGIAGLIIAILQILPPPRPPEPPPTTALKPPTPGQVPNGRIVLSDDFGAASSTWRWGERDVAAILHEPGEMRIIIKRGPLFQWNLVSCARDSCKKSSE